jgi:RNA polymerase sigma factor (sigma-70 family)
MSSQLGPGAVPNYETWFKAAGEELFQRAYFYTRDPMLAEDIAQEAAIKAYKAWGDAQMRDAILTSAAYRRTIVKNCFLDHIKVRSRTKQDEVELDDDRHGRAVTGSDHDLRLAILSLEDTEQEMIILVYYSGLTIGEAGTQLGIPAWRAYRLHERALANLAGLLNEGKG